MITVNTILDVALLFQLIILEICFGKLFQIIHKVGDQITTKDATIKAVDIKLNRSNLVMMTANILKI